MACGSRPRRAAATPVAWLAVTAPPRPPGGHLCEGLGCGERRISFPASRSRLEASSLEAGRLGQRTGCVLLLLWEAENACWPSGGRERGGEGWAAAGGRGRRNPGCSPSGPRSIVTLEGRDVLAHWRAPGRGGDGGGAAGGASRSTSIDPDSTPSGSQWQVPTRPPPHHTRLPLPVSDWLPSERMLTLKIQNRPRRSAGHPPPADATGCGGVGGRAQCRGLSPTAHARKARTQRPPGTQHARRWWGGVPRHRLCLCILMCSSRVPL